MSGTDYHQIRTTEATAPAGCPVDHHFNPLNDDYVLDPYPISSRMRWYSLGEIEPDLEMMVEKLSIALRASPSTTWALVIAIRIDVLSG